jgi:Domain of unknown function (DUF4397)
MRGKLYKVLPLAAILICMGLGLLAVGCGSSGAHFRYVQASTGSPGTNVDVDVDGSTKFTNIGFGAAATYQSVSSGSRQFELFLSGTTTNPFFNGTVPIASGFNTVVSMNTFSTMAISVYPDDNTAPTSGDVKLKFIHAAPTAGDVDIYVVTPNTGIGGLSPQLSASYKNATGFVSGLTAGTYEVVMTQKGTQNPIQGLDITYTWTAGQVRTIVILDSASGGAPYGLLPLSDLN